MDATNAGKRKITTDPSMDRSKKKKITTEPSTSATKSKCKEVAAPPKLPFKIELSKPALEFTGPDSLSLFSKLVSDHDKELLSNSSEDRLLSCVASSMMKVCIHTLHACICILCISC